MTLITSLLMLGRRSIGVKQSPQPPTLCTIGDIPGIKDADPRYVDVAFLGAHDANTGIATRGASLEPAATKTLRTFEPIVRNYLYRNMRTQLVPIYDQLTCGCRFIHIKVTLVGDKWYTSHSSLTGELQLHVMDILRFLSEQEGAGEIVSVLFQPIYFGDRSFADFHDYLAGIKYEGKNIFDYVRYGRADELRVGEGVKVGDLRYNDVTGKNGESGVVLFERRDKHYLPSWDGRESAYPYFFDMDSNALHVWHEHANMPLLDECIEKTKKEILSTDKYDDLLRMNQTQAASAARSFLDVVSAVFHLSLLKTAAIHNEKLIAREDFFDLLRAMPVFQVDFVTSTYGDFNQKVNSLIRQYNEKLVLKSSH